MTTSASGVGPFLDQGRMIGDLAAKMKTYDVRPPEPELKTANFSGGNAQKIVLAREIERDPELLLVGQPTRGVDIGAIEFIHRQLIAMRDKGKAILLVSVELEEMMALVGPHPRHVRRTAHRGAAGRQSWGAGARPSHGRRIGRGGMS